VVRSDHRKKAGNEMNGWGEYVAAFGLFLASHAFPVRPPVKPWLVARLGKTGFTLAYSALSVAILVWLITAAGRAPYVELWPRAEWQNLIALAALAAACLIIALAAFRPNPFSFGGWRDENFNASRPGIIGLVRHPYLAAIALWALGHLAPNGDLAHVLLFGGFSVLAVAGMRLIDRRRQREMGPAAWQALRDVSYGARAVEISWDLVVRLVAGFGLLILLILLHPAVIGFEAVDLQYLWRS
tara:strand:+ start:1273 stop:1998 length:726 start_codon:yes stop_codon:yes gene_type:complete